MYLLFQLHILQLGHPMDAGKSIYAGGWKACGKPNAKYHIVLVAFLHILSLLVGYRVLPPSLFHRGGGEGLCAEILLSGPGVPSGTTHENDNSLVR